MNITYHLFRTHTTGLTKHKKAKPFDTFEDALQAGQAINILEGTPDRVFLIISSDHMMCHTNITDPLPFSEVFYRSPRLSDSTTKFKNKSTTMSADIDLSLASGIDPMKAQLIAGALINPLHQGLSQSSISDEFLLDKSIYEILSSSGFDKKTAPSLQAYFQWKLGLIPMHRAITYEDQRLIELFEKIFPSTAQINEYISDLIMDRFIDWGSSETDKHIPFPSPTPN